MSDENALTTATAPMTGLEDFTEDFYWQHDPASKPAHLVIYSYRVKPTFQGDLLDRLVEAQENGQKYLNLAGTVSSLKGQLLGYKYRELTDDEERERAALEAKIAEATAELDTLHALPRTGNDVIADFFVGIIKSHNLVDREGKPLPLTREGFGLITPEKFQKLYDDIVSFLSPERRKKRKL